ncbi:sulfite exporter TauE/SafE family protein [Desulfolucanica intricata]|uniref:sulfite exporter TauE/SafE family protein n=1 Tax=Desulfolucanica intricata TaxID=1285191 RepID=UPI000836B32F|nr:sulfite exporter TauE/SafE family protein [Desulfolucanica intricata]
MFFEVADVTVSPVVLILWSIVTGYVFSSVGAAGGILAGIGHISIFGIKNANIIKPMNQILTTISPVVSTPMYIREKRIVVPVAISLAAGGIAGALLGSWLSHSYLPDLSSYKPFFGIVTYIVAVRLWYELTPGFRNRQVKVKEATKTFEAKVKELKENGRMSEIKEIGVNFTQTGLGNNKFTFAGQTFEYKTIVPFTAGLLVAIVSSSMGVGGGFLLVPFVTSFMGFPAFIVAGTVTLSILVTSLTSIINYIQLGSTMDYTMLMFELIGVAIGSYLGPKLSKYIKAVYFKALLAIILTYTGTSYVFGKLIFELTGFKM